MDQILLKQKTFSFPMVGKYKKLMSNQEKVFAIHLMYLTYKLNMITMTLNLKHSKTGLNF